MAASGIKPESQVFLILHIEFCLFVCLVGWLVSYTPSVSCNLLFTVHNIPFINELYQLKVDVGMLNTVNNY